MKPFNLEEAKAGKPICTSNGRKARIICTDFKNPEKNIVAAVQYQGLEIEELIRYTNEGLVDKGYINELDLKMVDEEFKCPFKPFDKVLIRDGSDCSWCCALFSHIEEVDGAIYYYCDWFSYDECIPYNEETEHLIGTNNDAPEKYAIW